MLICHPVTSRPSIFAQKEAVSSPCNFATTHSTACILKFYLPPTSRPMKWRTLSQRPNEQGESSSPQCKGFRLSELLCVAICVFTFARRTERAVRTREVSSLACSRCCAPQHAYLDCPWLGNVGEWGGGGGRGQVSISSSESGPRCLQQFASICSSFLQLQKIPAVTNKAKFGSYFPLLSPSFPSASIA